MGILMTQIEFQYHPVFRRGALVINGVDHQFKIFKEYGTWKFTYKLENPNSYYHDKEGFMEPGSNEESRSMELWDANGKEPSHEQIKQKAIQFFSWDIAKALKDN
jgi:hypothetical protein